MIALAELIVFRAASNKAPAEDFQAVLPADVPEQLKDPDVMARLVEDPYQLAQIGDWFYGVRKAV